MAFAGRQLEHSESGEILCVRRPKYLNALNSQQYKNLTEQIHCLCNNVIYGVSAAQINQQMPKGNRRCISIPVN